MKTDLAGFLASQSTSVANGRRRRKFGGLGAELLAERLREPRDQFAVFGAAELQLTSGIRFLHALLGAFRFRLGVARLCQFLSKIRRLLLNLQVGRLRRLELIAKLVVLNLQLIATRIVGRLLAGAQCVAQLRFHRRESRDSGAFRQLLQGKQLSREAIVFVLRG